MQMSRVERVAHQFQQEIAVIIQRELYDPHIGFVTITRVELTKDLRHGKVLFSFMGSEKDRDRSLKALNRSTRFIHGLLKKRFRLKTIPMLTFLYDPSIDVAIQMTETLDKLDEPKRSAEEPSPEEPSP